MSDSTDSDYISSYSPDDYFPGSKERVMEWKQSRNPACWVCKWNLDRHTYWDHRKLDAHHIQRRSSSYRDWKDVECNLFMTCNLCHATSLDSMAHSSQLAYKMKYDRENYHLRLWHHCRDGPELRSKLRVTQQEVDWAYSLLFG